MNPEHENWYLEPGYCNELLAECKKVLAHSYGIKLLAEDTRPLIIGENIDYLEGNFLERTTERTYYVTTEKNQYTLNFDDYDLFEQELEDVMGYDHDFDLQRLAHVLFIGQGVGLIAVRHLFGNNVPVEHKKEEYAQMLKAYFYSKDDFYEMSREVFSSPGFEERAHMVNVLSDKRAGPINGLRMSMRVLFDTFFVLEETGMEYNDLIEGAKKYIKKEYNKPDNRVSNNIMTTNGSKPEKIDELFFDRLPEWIVAAATPMKHESFRHLFSPAWQID